MDIARLPAAAARSQDDAGGAIATGTGYDLAGPYSLRSADPEGLSHVDLKFEYHFKANGDEEDDADEHAVEFIFAGGSLRTLSLSSSFRLVSGNGRFDGNGDIEEFGFHIRHWDENGLLPAFATRHLLRLPTGDQSDGVDYQLRGLFTWTLVPDSWRLRLKPFLITKNGNFDGDDDSLGFLSDDDGDERHLPWSGIVGFDWRLADDMIIILDYQNLTSGTEGYRYQHVIRLVASGQSRSTRSSVGKLSSASTETMSGPISTDGSATSSKSDSPGWAARSPLEKCSVARCGRR